jgi:hypothetical protein
MKLIKFIILLCLICSTGLSLFALYAEQGWVRTQKNSLALSSTTTTVDGIKQRFISLDEAGKTKFLNEFLINVGNQDKSISNSIDHTFIMTKYIVKFELVFNALIAFCVICLPINEKK